MARIDELLDEIIKNYDEDTMAHSDALELKQALIDCFKAMLDDKDKQVEAMDAKVEMQEEIDEDESDEEEDDVYNGMMLMINHMIKYMPELQDVVNKHYEQVK